MGAVNGPFPTGNDVHQYILSGEGRVGTPPWGHKPASVRNVFDFWGDSPPVMSPRCAYWIARHAAGTWKSNKYLRREDPGWAAEHLGVWLWEYLHVIRPLFEEEARG